MGDRLKGKVALITGGASGIGKATVMLFLREGAKVMVADRNRRGIDETVAEGRKISRSVYGVAADVSKLDQISAMVSATVKKFGRIDALVNAAGVLVLTPEIEDVDERDWDQIMDTNLKGLFFCTQSTVRQMLKQGSGSIVNIASITGYQGQTRSIAYSISKAAVMHLTKVAASQCTPRGIRVNAVAPGLIDTPQARGSSQSAEALARGAANHPMGRIGQPEEMAEVILFLASDASSFISGETILADGGSMAGGRQV
ncbi:MAG: SDR family oxidoreductase [SAR202 cluster bacterium]|nr:SDR family oxidoreductase [SAR202 cluster bacterium]